MASGNVHPLPKFGEWDVNNPASAEGFTVIFTKARNEKKTSNSNPPLAPIRDDVNDLKTESPHQSPRKSKKLFCCC
ncbi:protein NOI4-like [Zingiber officinale]|uniref:protein NOI4-like n=1 Tax=Zingiber officinale TaxID=94328 RepID=UPI001C4D1920|nr:protein NOI4-like [Zingiber officinale]XP_042385830.1 protein NOI4-like [Zingiber officinale]